MVWSDLPQGDSNDLIFEHPLSRDSRKRHRMYRRVQAYQCRTDCRHWTL